MGCLFCKIVNGEIPAEKIYEDDACIGIIDINPVSAGHALVIPRQHCLNLFDSDDELLAKVGVATRNLANLLMEALGAQGVNVIQNNGAAAGQVIHHSHIHIVPRHDGDGIHIGGRMGKYADGEMRAVADRIRAAAQAGRSA